MIIELKASAQARKPSGGFVTVEAGAKVNYSSANVDGALMAHTFVANHEREMVVCTVVAPKSENPPWL